MQKSIFIENVRKTYCFIGKTMYTTYGHAACTRYVDKIADMYVVKTL